MGGVLHRIDPMGAASGTLRVGRAAAIVAEPGSVGHRVGIMVTPTFVTSTTGCASFSPSNNFLGFHFFGRNIHLRIYLVIWVKEKNMYHTVSSHHKIHSWVPNVFGSVRIFFIFRVKGKMKNQRIRLCYLWVYGIKDALDIARNICPMKMQLVVCILTDVIQCLLCELTHPFKIQVCLLAFKFLVKAISCMSQVYFIVLHRNTLIL